MTLNEMIVVIKAENPTIKIGDDEAGYTELTGADYDAQIADWAAGRLDKLARLADIEAAKLAKIDTMNKLIALGIDPKSLGLEAEQSTPIVIDEAEAK
jgi:hypothetical protein